MSSGKEPAPKIVVDADWKSQVEAERAALRAKSAPQAAPAEPAYQGPASQEPVSQEPVSQELGAKEPPLPPASFPLLVSTLATQALVLMGHIADPATKQAVVHLPAAKHHIDMLSVLEQKTKGNLEPDEQAMLASVLHELRMAYVAASSRKPAKA